MADKIATDFLSKVKAKGKQAMSWFRDIVKKTRYAIPGKVGRKELMSDRNIGEFLTPKIGRMYLIQYDAALNCFEQVLSVKPQNTTALYNKASSLIKSGNVPDGLEILSQVIKLDFSFKAKAKFDLDFEEIKKLNEFRKITM